jgi:alkaline phosphatase
MNRRLFLRQSSGAFCLLACSNVPFFETKAKIRFGLVADLHFAVRQNNKLRYYDQSRNKLIDAINIFNESNLDFVIELGDFKDQGTIPEKLRTLAFLEDIEHTLKKFNGPIYHVLGNHDMDSISKDEFLKHTTNFGEAKLRNYYSFIQGGIKFIVLDANYNEDGSDYNSGNFDWTYSMIPDDQKRWLQYELGKDKLPVILFVHQLLDYFSSAPKNVYVRNAKEIVGILEKNKNVLGVFQGHHHPGNYSFRNGIHFFTMKAMVEGSFPDNNSFAIVEINENLDCMITGFYNCENMFLQRS